MNLDRWIWSRSSASSSSFSLLQQTAGSRGAPIRPWISAISSSNSTIRSATASYDHKESKYTIHKPRATSIVDQSTIFRQVQMKNTKFWILSLSLRFSNL